MAVLLVLALVLCLMPATAFALDENETEIISVPCVTKVTPTTISVKAMDNVQYRLGSTGTWTSEAVFSGLYPNTNYTVYYRYGTGDAVSLGTTTTPQAEYITKNSTTIDAAATAFPSADLATFSHSIDFRNNLNLIYFYSASKLSGYTNVRFFIQKEVYGKNVTTCTYSNYTFGQSKYSIGDYGYGSEYSFTVPGIASTEMVNKVYVTVYAEKNGVTYVSPCDAYSVEDYVLSRLSKSSNDNYKKMLVDLLNYGAASQTYFQEPASHLANANLTSQQAALANTSVTLSGLTNYKNEPAASTATFTGNNVLFEDVVILRYYFTIQSGYNLANVTFNYSYTTSDNRSVNVSIPSNKFHSADGEYYIDISNIDVTDMGSKITATIKNNGTAISGNKTYSIESYCAAKANSTNANFVSLIQALMRYSYSARTYFN